MADPACIELEDVVAGYGELVILNRLSLRARRGKVTLLIGPNGAGKSTALKTMFGLVRVRRGQIRLDGQDITGTAPRDLLTRHGVAFVPQGRNLFGSLSVRHNLELGGITLPRAELPARIEEALARFPRIRERIDNQASTMSGGEQKQLEISRALLLRQQVILIDEPSIGLSPLVARDVFRLLRERADAGTTVLVVEQNVKSALAMADDAIALAAGRQVMHRRADELLAEPDLERLFLG